MRVGIAYYEKKNYSLAEGYFKKALKFNSTDDLALEYLYYCYFFTGKIQEARILSTTFNTLLKQKIGINNQSAIQTIFVEGGTKISDSASYYDASKKTNSNYFNSPVYFQIGLNHYIKNKISLVHVFTYFNQQTFLGSIKQPQYYLKATFALKNNWQISPSFHWVNIKSTKDVMFQPPNNNMGNSPPRPQSNNNTNTTISNYFVGSLSIQKNIKKITLGVGSLISNINNVTQYIHNGFVSYSVFGNSKLVVGCTGYLHTTDNYLTTYTSFAPFIYLQPITRLSIKVAYLYNSKNNILEDNGYIINNSPDLTNYRYSGLINCIITKHIAIYGLYQLEFKQEKVQLFNYRYNVLVGGIKITP